MSKARTESGPFLIERSIIALHDLGARIEHATWRRGKSWSLMLADKTISFLTMVLLLPAIVAVWIAIRRSAPANTVIGQSLPPDTGSDDSGVLLTIKPEPYSAAASINTDKAIKKRAMSA